MQCCTALPFEIPRLGAATNFGVLADVVSNAALRMLRATFDPLKRHIK